MSKLSNGIRVLALVLGFTMLSTTVIPACTQATPTTPSATATGQSAKPAGQSAGQPEQKSNPLKVGLVLALSGTGAVFADPAVQGSQLAQKEVKSAGIAGRDINVVTVDDATDPKVATDVCTRLVQDEGANVIVALQGSPTRQACLGVADRARVPYVFTTFAEPGITSKYFVGLGENFLQDNSAAADYMIEKQGAKNFYLVGADTILGHTALDYLGKYLSGKGAKAVAEQYIPLGTTDFNAVIAKIVQSGADSLVVQLFGADMMAFIKQLRAAPGTDKLNVYANLDQVSARAVGQGAKGIVVAGSYFDSLATPENAKFKSGLQAMFGSKATVAAVGATVYDAVHLVARAAQKANSTQPEALLGALREVSFKGPRGEIKIGKNGYAVVPIYVALLNADGTATVVKEVPPVEPGR